MRIAHLPDDIAALAFDIDRTLYTNEPYVRSQIDALLERLAAERDEPLAETERVVDTWRAEYAAVHDGRSPSLGNTFAGLGIPIETSVRWREELIDPFAYLEPDGELDRTLGELGCAYRMLAVTNNPRLTGRHALEALGVLGHFETIIGLDTAMRSKPDPAPFVAARDALGCPAEQIVSIGDRYEVDLAPAIELGMGAILVDGVEDVYSLPGVLLHGRGDRARA